MQEVPRAFANTHACVRLHTLTCFLRQGNCEPPLAVKPCQYLVSACIGSFFAGSIGKGQSDVVCTVTQREDCTGTAGSAHLSRQA